MIDKFNFVKSKPWLSTVVNRAVVRKARTFAVDDRRRRIEIGDVEPPGLSFVANHRRARAVPNKPPRTISIVR